MIRLVPNHADAIVRGPEVTFVFDGAPVKGFAGESVVAALLRAGMTHLRSAPVDGRARGAFCLMGLCQECAIRVDGQVREGCRTVVVDGMTVERVR